MTADDEAATVELLRRQRDTIAILADEPLAHAPELDANSNPTNYALCGADNGQLANNTWRATCPDCADWYDQPQNDTTGADR